MGNSFGINLILNRHKKLEEKEIENKCIDTDLLFFNIPITFERARQVKSYSEQICNATDDELSNTAHNELYLHKHKIIITSDDIITNIEKPLDRYEKIHMKEKNIYKHFDFVEDTEGVEPEELEEGLKKIADYENEIKVLEMRIKQEKQKILNLDYVKSRFNGQVSNVKEYIETIKYIHDKYFDGRL